MTVASAGFFIANFVLPGAWLAFSPLLRRFDGWIRLLFSIVLSLPVASLEYEILRLPGLGSDAAVALLPAINLPALLLVWRARQSFRCRSAGSLLAHSAAIAVPVVFLAVAFAVYDERAFWGHTWLHADMIYALRQDPTAPEERQLAGMVATYPWFGHLFFLIQSTALDRSPLQSFTAINLVLAAAFGGFAIATMRVLGAGRAGTLAAPFLFSFALNPLGVALGHLMLQIGQPVARWSYLAGDPRYDFLLIKHLRLDLNQVGLTMLAALLLLIVEGRRSGREGVRQVALLALMVAVVTLHYPLYLPVALAFVGARVVAEIALARPRDWWFIVAATVACGSAGAAAAWLVMLPLGPRAVPVGIGLAGPGLIWRQAVMISVACSLPALAALWILARRGARLPDTAEATLLAAAVGSGLLAVFMYIPNKWNEYKFVFAAGMALMPFVALAVDALGQRWRPRTAAVAAVLFAGFCLAGAIDSVSRREMRPEDVPRIGYQGIYQTVAADDPVAASVDVIRRDTPEDAVLLADDTAILLSGVTLRAQFVPYDPDRAHPGMTFTNDYLLTSVKGYDPTIVATRRATLRALFDGPDDAGRDLALGRARSLGRPLVLLVAAGRHPGFEDWLGRTAGARRLHGDPGYSVWLLPARG